MASGPATRAGSTPTADLYLVGPAREPDQHGRHEVLCRGGRGRCSTRIPALRASRVFAREHAHLGEIPVAEVVPADPARPPDPRALTAFCRERLPGYKIPREFRVVEQIARTSSGKLRRSSGED